MVPTMRNPRVRLNSDGSKRIVRPSEGGYGHVAACVGSGTLSYGAMGWRFMPQDFQMKTIYGCPEGSTLDDWPITYDQLEPYYERAEWEIGVAGDDSQNPFAPPRKRPQPMPPFPYNKEARVIEAAAKRLGYHPFPIPMLRNSRPRHGRPQCIHHRSCVGFACPVNAKNGTQKLSFPPHSPRETANSGPTASLVGFFSTTRDAHGVQYFDRDDQQQTQTADIVVVAASATETARLLLNSKSKLFPNGAGNNTDWVGRNLQGHAYTGAYGLFDQELYEEAGPGACIALCDFNHGNDGFIGGAMLANEFTRMPYLFAGRRPPGAARWGIEHKDFQRRNYKLVASVKGPVQEIPNFDARVDVDPDVKDHWGIPVARISGNRNKLDIDCGRFIARRPRESSKKPERPRRGSPCPAAESVADSIKRELAVWVMTARHPLPISTAKYTISIICSSLTAA